MKLILLTGFLGSGKTTLLSQLLETYHDTKIGVLMNEFGETSIDGQLIQGTDFDLMELTNGSIFCACLKENFIKGLAEFLDRDLEILFVESSGVADPSNMETILEMVEKLSKKSYDYLGSICIVDGLYFLKQLEVIAALRKQIIYANDIIVNKADLQNIDELDEINEALRGINANATIYRTSFCKVPIKEIVKEMDGIKVLPQSSGNTWESRPITKILKTNDVFDFEAMKGFLSEIAVSTYRIKGFFKSDKGNYEVSGVNDSIELIPWNKEIENTEIVFISSVGIRIISDLRKAWEHYFKSEHVDFK